MPVTIKSGEHLVIEIPVEEKLAHWLNRAKEAEAEILRLREGLRDIKEDYCCHVSTEEKVDILLK